jgi:hypothetical protein
MTEPTVGRNVHYVSYGTPNGEYASLCRAAIITEAGQWVTVDSTSPDPNTRVLTQQFERETCALAVWNPTGVFFNSGGVPIRHDETEKMGGTWHWPEGAPHATNTAAYTALDKAVQAAGGDAAS